MLYIECFSFRSVLDDVQQLHKTRQKSHGVSAESLAVGKQVTKEEKAEVLELWGQARMHALVENILKYIVLRVVKCPSLLYGFLKSEDDNSMIITNYCKHEMFLKSQPIF